MAISPIEFSGTITRTQDFTPLKQHEDQKGAMQQANFQTKMEKVIENQITQVRTADDADKRDKKKDAKEKGDNQYSGDGGQRRRGQKEKEEEGKVVVKGMNRFDVTI